MDAAVLRSVDTSLNVLHRPTPSPSFQHGIEWENTDRLRTCERHFTFDEAICSRNLFLDPSVMCAVIRIS